MSDSSYKRDHNIDKMIYDIKEGFNIFSPSININENAISVYFGQFIENLKDLPSITVAEKDNIMYPIPNIVEVKNFIDEHKIYKYSIMRNEDALKLSECNNNSDINSLPDPQKVNLYNILHKKAFEDVSNTKTFKNLKIANPNPKDPSQLFVTNTSAYYENLQKKVLKLVKITKIPDSVLLLVRNYTLYQRLDEIGETDFYESNFYKFLQLSSQVNISRELKQMRENWNCDNKFDENVVYIIKKKFFARFAKYDTIKLLFMYYIIDNAQSQFICDYIKDILPNFKQKISEFLAYKNDLEYKVENFRDLFDFTMKLASEVHECQGIENFINIVNRYLKNFLKTNENDKNLLYLINSLKEKQIFNPLRKTLIEKFSSKILNEICFSFPPVEMLLSYPHTTNESIRKEVKEIVKYGPILAFMKSLMSKVNYDIKYVHKKDIASDVLNLLYTKIGEPFKSNLVLPYIIDPNNSQKQSETTLKQQQKQSETTPKQQQKQSETTSKQQQKQSETTSKQQQKQSETTPKQQQKQSETTPKQQQKQQRPEQLITNNKLDSPKPIQPKVTQSYNQQRPEQLVTDNKLDSPTPNQPKLFVFEVPKSPKPKQEESPKQPPKYPDIEVAEPREKQEESPKPKNKIGLLASKIKPVLPKLFQSSNEEKETSPQQSQETVDIDTSGMVIRQKRTLKRRPPTRHGASE